MSVNFILVFNFLIGFIYLDIVLTVTGRFENLKLIMSPLLVKIYTCDCETSIYVNPYVL